MELQPKRGGPTRTNAVAAGSVWETRMKMDQVMGGIKVFDGQHHTTDHQETPTDNTTSPLFQDPQTTTPTATTPINPTTQRKRKNWKQAELESDPIELRRALSQLAGAPEDEDTPPDLPLEDETVVETCYDHGGVEVEKKVDKVMEVSARVPPLEVVEAFMDSGHEKSGKLHKSQNTVMVVDAKDSLVEKSKRLHKMHRLHSTVEVVETLKDSFVEKSNNRLHKSHKTVEVVDAFKDSLVEKNNRLHKSYNTVEVDEVFRDSLDEHSYKMNEIVDLVMWRDLPRSAFVFGVGIFLLISSSYAQDLNFSFISTVSYMGLLYLTSVFLYKSFFIREVEEFWDNDEVWAIGEEEAIWFIKMALPCMNLFLHKLRSFFSGDPATTMKVGFILFGIGKCGGQMTVWTMSKLAFLGLFTIPKLWASHSDQIRGYGISCLKKMRTGWESCRYKKLVAIVFFALFWNLSSVSSRIWAVFMLLVSLRYYHDHLLAVGDWTSAGYSQNQNYVAPLISEHVARDGQVPVPSLANKKEQRAVTGGGNMLRHRMEPTGFGGVGTKSKKRA